MTTLSTAMRRPVTIEYPDQKHVLSVRERSFPILLYDFEHDEPFCTGCNICVRNCPVDCMTAVMKDNPKYDTGESDKKKIAEKFWIDYARCMRCNICVEVCPFEAIAMDNTWAGHEHAVYDRLDLHLDIEDLLAGSKAGEIANPFFPYDNIAKLDAELEGKEAPPDSALGARPEARQAALERVAQGLPMGLKGEPPADARKPAAAAGGAAGQAGAGVVEGGTGKGEFHSPEKQRARRMRAERKMKEVGLERGLAGAELDKFIDVAGQFAVAGTGTDEAVEQALAGATPPEVGAPGAPVAAASAAAAGGASPTGEIWLPAGPKGDPMSLEKQRARRMRAERRANEAGPGRGVTGADLERAAELAGLFAMAGDSADDAIEKGFAGEPLPDVVQQAMGAVSGGGAAAVAPPAAAAGGEEFALPLGAKGEANSPEKQRARRMRAERKVNELAAGRAPWTTQTGLVVRGYVSKIDGSVQPYGLVIPASYDAKALHRHRLDIWCHGRGETLSELNFIRGRQTSVGDYAPADTIVLHPYGRYCNANKFAGEVDVLE
ncbi:MAG: 4Fe-4S binding protein, partial [Dehalococcoidia bacterium]